MTEGLFEKAKKHLLVVAHRGVSGGNIPGNTRAAYEGALMQGADMIETDVSRSKDGTLIIFHPEMEPHFLGKNIRLPDLTMEEIEKLRYLNADETPTQFGILRFDDLLETYKDKCLINVDKFWDHPQEIYEAVKRHDMAEQIVVKSAPSENVLRVLEDLAPDLAYIPIVRETHPLHETLMKSQIRYVGADVLFTPDDAEVASPAFIERMHKDGKLVWVNSIIYNYRDQLAAGHSDDTALCGDPDTGWGWLADRGYDMIQTDWCLLLIEYLKKTNRYYR